MVAVALHLAPDQVWSMAPKDLATVVDVLQEQAKKSKGR
jgi:Phage tail assembly chaperone protein, TAC